jgi:hypothetical protein
MKKIIILFLVLSSLKMFSEEERYKGGFCLVERAATYDQPNPADPPWMQLECYDSSRKLAKGATNLKKQFVPAHLRESGTIVKRFYPSFLVIDGHKLPNNGPDAMDYFDVISSYGKNIEDCKNKFKDKYPKLSCKHIGIILQPEANIFEQPNYQNMSVTEKKLNEGKAQKAKNQFPNQDFVQTCEPEGCGRRNAAVVPPAEPSVADLKSEKPAEKQTISKSCIPNQAKFEALQNKASVCLSGFQSNQSNAKAMYKTIAQYLSCEKFDFVSAEVKQEGTHPVAVAREPASSTGCEIKMPIDIDANLGYGKISFKDKTGKTVDVDWDSRFDSSNSANTEVYWKNDFGKKLMATLNTNGSGSSTTQPPAGSNK